MTLNELPIALGCGMSAIGQLLLFAPTWAIRRESLCSRKRTCVGSNHFESGYDRRRLRTEGADRPIRWQPATPSEPEADEALSRVQREVFARLHGFVEEKILRIPRQQWMEAFEYRGAGSTFSRAKVIQTIYDSSAPVPGPALDPLSEQFLRTVRVLVHEAIREGGGELVTDILGQPSLAVTTGRRTS